ncbi:RNA-binding Raly-like protein [Sciurus carolinensis]|uniref:RNA-binding Raly-like protein n=1 Tax=Sciurus carolinensis TaxID=30640 RepID=A0AA41T9X2_SCICA|nr:RNA-binding Raly-like protein [Sciurus carolinensis]
MTDNTQTNNVIKKNDTKSISSWDLVFNLNRAIAKDIDVKAIFSKYGKIVGCSVHQGYTFVQYMSEWRVRAEVAAVENASIISGQPLRSYVLNQALKYGLNLQLV